jgi:hypothetical protein
VTLLPLLCAKLFAPLAALGTTLGAVSALPAGPDLSATQPKLVAMQPPSALLTGRTPLHPAAGREFSGTPQVGALVWQKPDGTPGARLCTAAAVDSPSGDVIATAAHCVSGVTLGVRGTLSIAYVPDYAPGRAPYGVWYPTRITVPQQWAAKQDPDYDLALVDVARPMSSVPLEQVTGAERFSGPTVPAAGTLGVLLGYPYHLARPVACRAAIQHHSPRQLRFACANFPAGTSGGPLLTGVDPETGIGTLAGVIGGYRLGGDRDDVSYAAALGPAMVTLYQNAVTSAPSPLLVNGVLQP